MYIVEVTPFSKSVRQESLSYFHNSEIKPGSIVTIPLRNKSIKGLVINSQNIKRSKSEIRSLDYALKKVKGVSKDVLIPEEFVNAARITADYFGTSIGSVIQTMIPNAISDDLEKVSKVKNKKDISQTSEVSPKYIIQTTDNDRYSEYKTIIRQQFAKNKSVIFCVPTIEGVQKAEKLLSRGIEKQTFSLHSKKTKANILKTWNSLSNLKKPSLIISTSIFMGVPVKNPGTIITEAESSSAYKTLNRPYFDKRYFIEKYAEFLKVNLIFGDLLLRMETLLRYDEGELLELIPIKFRIATGHNKKLVNLKDKSELINPDFSISESLNKLIIEKVSNNEKIFLLVSRKGLSPTVVCGDCGQIVKCHECGSSIVLHGKDVTKSENYFRCHYCGAERSAGEKCQNCNSWKLITLGTGTEKVEKEIKKLLPKANIFVLDKDRASTTKKANDVVEKFYESASGILIGTEMALLYLNQEIENVAVVSVDSMLSIPSFKIREKIINIISKSKSLAKENFLLQTRSPENLIFQSIMAGNLTDFYRQEFIDRKKLNYPPFNLIIKISLATKDKNKSEIEFKKIEELLSPHKIIIYPGLNQKSKGIHLIHGIIKIPKEKWPDNKVIKILRQLPPQFRVEIDAESLI